MLQVIATDLESALCTFAGCYPAFKTLDPPARDLPDPQPRGCREGAPPRGLSD